MGPGSTRRAATRPQVLVLDPIWSQPWNYDIERTTLAARDVDLVVPAGDIAEPAALAACDVVISSGRVPVTAEIIAGLSNCVGVLCYSAGRNAVDEAAASAAGLAVAGVHAATDDVADHAIALLLAAVRRIGPLSRAADDGTWDYTRYPEIWAMPRLAGRTMGIVGAGHVGQAVATRARAFGLRTVATYHRPPAIVDPALPHVPLIALFASSDFVVLTAALTSETAGMVDAGILAAARPGLVLVNVARGGLLDEDALADALDRGIVACAALDVRATEPPDPATDRLTGRANVLQTPHVAGASSAARGDLHELAAAGALALLAAAGRIDPATPDAPVRSPRA